MADTKSLLDLRLSGIDIRNSTPDELGLLQDRVSEKNQLFYFSVLTIVYAIQELGQYTAGSSGGQAFQKTSGIMRTLRDMLFPEIAEDLADKASKTQELIQKEIARGPMQVQRLDYEKGKRRRGKR